MKKIIYLEDAIDGVKTLHEVAWKNWHEPTLSANVVIDMIKDLPSVQPEDRCGECDAWNQYKNYPRQPEIIHCRDCKHRGEKPITDGRYWCEIHDTFMYYCSDAERRTDEEVNIS